MKSDINLYCIPHAGGLASFYNIWIPYFKNTSINIYPLEMKGHGSRFNENDYLSIEEAASDTFKQIMTIQKSTGNHNYAILGHSMGSYIELEVLKIIEQLQMKEPIACFMSGKGAPSAVDEIHISQLSDQQFIDQIGTLGEISDELLKYPDLLSIFTSTIKDDYRAVEHYDHSKKISLSEKHVFVLNGIDDVYATALNKEAWQGYFDAPITIKDFPGGHFFIKDSVATVTGYILNNLEELHETV